MGIYGIILSANKRGAVTLESTTLLLTLTQKFKEEIGIAANKNNMSSNELIRRAVAAFINYDLDAEKGQKPDKRGRPKLYATSAEREKARRQQNADRKKLVDMLLEHARSQEHQNGIKALETSLQRRSKTVHVN